jgi:predicted NodU family carbamoyl transferase
MNILGINISHHASSCLINETGEILYYIEEERLSRIKDIPYDVMDIEYEYKFYAIDLIKKHTNSLDYVIFTSFDRINDLDYTIIDSITKQLLNSGIHILNEPIYERGMHHYYHACNAFYGSNFDKSICIVLDGGGSMPLNQNNLTEKYHYPFREIESIYECSYDKGIVPLYKHYSYLDKHSEEYQNKTSDLLYIDESKGYKEVFSDSLSCGDLFNLLCDILKFDGSEAGKVMGLSSYGKFLDNNEWFVHREGEWITRDNFVEFLYEKYQLNDSEVRDLLDNNEKPFANYNPKVEKESHEILINLTYKLQEQTLNHTLRIIEKAYSLSSFNNIVISGGYALNCVNNYKYLSHVKGNFYIDPISHDGGTSMGASKDLLIKKTSNIKLPLNNIYLS